MAEIIGFLGIFGFIALPVLFDIQPRNAFPLIGRKLLFEEGVGVLDGIGKWAEARNLQPRVRGDRDELEPGRYRLEVCVFTALDAVTNCAIGLRNLRASISDEVPEGAIGIAAEADTELPTRNVSIAEAIVIIPEFRDFSHARIRAKRSDYAQNLKSGKGFNEIVHREEESTEFIHSVEKLSTGAL